MRCLMFIFTIYYFLNNWLPCVVDGKEGTLNTSTITSTLKNLTVADILVLNGTEFQYNAQEENSTITVRNRTNAENETEYETEDDDEETEDEPPDDKYISKPADITLEHIDFIQLRLSHIAKKTSSNITELRQLQKEEFKVNEMYKDGWKSAVELFNSSKRAELFEGFSNDSIVKTIPEEYHIALIAYSEQTPPLYSDFNKKTRDVCSGKDIDKYHYQSYFKLLLLAIEALGKETKFRSGQRFLYRGLGSLFSLKVGQVLAFQQFVSTSSSLMVAEDFAGKTLFEVQGRFDSTAVSIKDHSVYAGEEEVLFSPFQVYEVESKHEGKYYTRYVLISHKLPQSTGDCALEDGGTVMPHMLGHNQTLRNSGDSIRIIFHFFRYWLYLGAIFLCNFQVLTI